ncbi:MAG TPA: SOS response-associated peptidase [Azospirillum sp.]|nr:SOS response-associated peptidase [Azospirillum sp.]
MTLATPVAELRRVFEFSETPNLRPRWNIAPTQDVAAVRAGEDGARHLALLRWGLVPHWADDPAIGNRMINARGETLADKPAFRSAFRHRRCLVPADGFYEWKAAGRRKQPYLIRRRDGRPLAFAGLWERWPGPKGDPLPQPLETVTIVTTAAGGVVADLHERMPVMLNPADWPLWLDPQAPLPAVETLLRPAPDPALEAVPVSTRVNDVRNDDDTCIVPFDAPPTLF